MYNSGLVRYAVMNLSLSIYSPSSSRGFSASGVSAVSKNLYPFPNHKNPTPHQIFHLPLGADQHAIKARYYELVKIHHPDACHGLDPAVSHERFQRIQQAYTFLRRGKRSTARPVGHDYAAYRYAPQKAPDGSTRRWTGQMNQWGGFKYEYDHEFNPTAKKPGAAQSEQRQTEKIFHKDDTFYWVFAAVTVVVGVGQFIIFSPAAEASKHHAMAIAVIDKAQREREEFGAARREEIRKFVEDKRREKRLATADLALSAEEN
ncbi:hypothetical protein FRB90_010981 [Tulasnella sp. 427]|nr:hypothetical protein FRB90_010981 [Tulasnella sp. 427]